MEYIIVRFIIKLTIKIICKLKIIGLDKIPLSGACIIASNHIGRLEGFLVYTIISRNDIVFPMAKKYKNTIFLSLLVNALNGIWIDRHNADIGAYREIEKKLKKGGILCISPEGTRSKTASLIQGKSGASYWASKYQVPIIPVAITGAEDQVVITSIKKLKRVKVSIIFGKPFFLKPLTKKNRKAKLQEYTDEIMCRIAVLLPRKYHGFYTNHPRLKALQINAFNANDDSVILQNDKIL